MKLPQLETQLRELKAKASKRIEEIGRACEAHVVTPATATAPAVTGRTMTDEERAEINSILADAEAVQKKIDGMRSDDALLARVNEITGGQASRTPAGDDGIPRRDRRSIGQQFVQSAEYKAWLASGAHRRSGNWSSPSIECADATITLYGTTLTEDPASGGALIPPQILPGIIPLPQRRVVVADLIAPGTATSNVIQFMREKTFTNAAAPVAEGTAKPESALIFEAATSAVRKIAHFLPVTEEMLEDVAQIASYIDARLRLGLSLKEEDQLLNGDGVAPDLLGFLNTPGLTPAHPRGTDNNMDAMYKQMQTIATTVFIMPDAWVMNPANWQTVQLAKNAQGYYYGPGPWAMPQGPQLWGLPGAITPAMAAGTSLVGAFRTMSQIFRRGGVRVEASNSHQDFFIKNLVAIRGEERLALCVYRPAAFGEVTGLN